MSTSGFRMSHVVPQSWFHKLTVNLRRINCREDSRTEVVMQRTISLPRSGYYREFASSGGRGFESPRGPKEKEDNVQMDKKKNKAGRKVKAKLLRSKSNNSRPKASIETRVSTGCICRAKVGSKRGGKIVKRREKNKVVEKSFEVFEMEKGANPCTSVDLAARKRNKGCGKDYSDSSTVSFDGAVVESLPQLAAAKSNERLRRCSPMCCACSLSFESDDVDFWSEEEEKVEVPFLRNSDSEYDRLVADMKVNCSMEDLKESAATLCRPGDAASHAQVQAKLSQMIRRKGSKNESSQKLENLGGNRKNITSSMEFQASEASGGPETALEGINFRKMFNFRDEIKRQSNTWGGDAEGRAKIDRGGSRQGGCRKPIDEKIVDRCKCEDKYASKGMRKISESFAIVKCSYDPRRDFTESMVEMIVENEIRNSHDLWELLRCYISLNSKEYREIILEVFEQVCSQLLAVNP